MDVATDALAWKLIGFEAEVRKFNPKNIKIALFCRILGDSGAADFKKAAIRILAHRIRAHRADPKEFAMQFYVAGSIRRRTVRYRTDLSDLS